MNKLFTLLFMLTAAIGFAQPTINNVTVVDAICKSDGSFSVDATSSGGTLTYSIASGTACAGKTYPINNGTVSTFNDFCPGTYNLQVTDNNGTTSQMVTIGGTYVEPLNDLMHTDPICNGDLNATIINNITNGLAPFNYSVSGGTITGTMTVTGGTANEVITGLGPGTYTVTVTDACGSVQTNMETIDPTPVRNWSVGISPVNNPKRINCTDARYIAGISFGPATPDITWTIARQATPGTIIETVTNSNNSSPAFILPHANDPYIITATDACGRTDDVVLDYFDKSRVSEHTYFCDSFTLPISQLDTFGETVSVTITNQVTGATQTINGANAGGAIIFENLDYGDYDIVITNECGETKTLFSSATPALAVDITGTSGFDVSTCLGYGEGRVNFSHNDNRPWTWEFIDFPADFDNPDNTSQSTSGTVGISSPNFVNFNSLSVGDYTFAVEDACGNRDTIMFTSPFQGDWNLDITTNPGCNIGEGSVSWTVSSSNLAIEDQDNFTLDLIQNGVLIQRVFGSSDAGTISNLNPGTYELQILINSTNICERRDYTFEIPDYIQPDIDQNLFAVACDDGSVFISGEGINGSAPYDFNLFDVDADPTFSTPLQTVTDATNFEFSGLPSGTSYAVQILDQCPNGDTRTVNIESAINLSIVTDCVPGETILQVDALAGVTYEWTRSSTGEVVSNTSALSLSDPVSSSEADTYTITATLQNASGLTCQTATDEIIMEAGTTCSILPIELQSFTAEAGGADTYLEWVTATETDNSHFEVEYSLNGIDFLSVQEGRVASLAVDGNSQEQLTYEYKHKGAASWANSLYYRLKQVDFDGTFAYTPIRLVNFEGVEIDAKLFPNPVTHGNQVVIQANEIKTIEVYNMQGVLMNQVEIEGDNQRSTSISTAGLPSGIYSIVINGTKTMKLVVQ